MKHYEVRFNVNGRSCGSIMVQAPNSSTARRIALGELMGKAGYADKKITITGVFEK